MPENSKKVSTSSMAEEKSPPAANRTAAKGSPPKAAGFAWIKPSKGAVSKAALKKSQNYAGWHN